MAFIVTDFNEYKSYGNCLNEHFVFHLAILKGVARMGKYFSVSIEALAPKQLCMTSVNTVHLSENHQLGSPFFWFLGVH